MSDDVVLSGGGLTAVDTDAQLHLARVLAALVQLCGDSAAQVQAVVGHSVSDAPVPASLARPWLATGQEDAGVGCEAAERAVVALRRSEEVAARLNGELLLGAEAYGAVERGLSALMESLVGSGAWALGAIVGGAARFHEIDRRVAPDEAGFMEEMGVTWARSLLSPLLAPALTAVALVALNPRVGPALTNTAQRALRDLVSSVAAARLLRTAVSSADDVLAGAGDVPLPLARAYHAAGGGGVAAVALLIARGADARGLFTPAPVTVAAVAPPEPVRPPRTVSELMERMPGNAPGDPQVRIERHVDATGGERWIVWSGGTIEMLPDPDSTEPWDGRSNLNAVAGAAAESVLATQAAMVEAGVPPGASVLHVGYSQGGIVAAAIAASGDYDSSLVTFGAPVETIPLPAGVAALHVQHDEDIVPALSGERSAPVDGGRVARRSLYDGAAPPPAEPGVSEPVPAHLARNYLDTARLLDHSTDPGVAAALRQLDGLTDQGEQASYRADKVLQGRD